MLQFLRHCTVPGKLKKKKKKYSALYHSLIMKLKNKFLFIIAAFAIFSFR